MEYAAANLNIENFLQYIDRNVPVLVDFFATWCEPCKYLDEILDVLEKRMGAELRIIKADVDEQPVLKTAYHIMSVPTLMLFSKKELLWRMPGFMLVNDLEEKIKSVLAETKS